MRQLVALVILRSCVLVARFAWWLSGTDQRQPTSADVVRFEAWWNARGREGAG